MDKYESTVKLLNDTAQEISGSEKGWTDFLTSAGHMYKYPFDEQVLIYAQNPNATAAASFEIWNEKMHCRIKKGSRGIALIDDSSDHIRLKYVFDISDVYKEKDIGRFPKQWRVTDGSKGIVADNLEKNYGELKPEDFGDKIIGLAEILTDDCMPDMMNDLLPFTGGSRFDGMRDEDISESVRLTMKSSMAYIMLTSCGLDTGQYMDRMDFSHISDFGSGDMLRCMGGYVNSMVKPVLINIGRTAATYEKNMEAAEKAEERSSNDSIDISRRSGWNVISGSGSRAGRGEGTHELGQEAQEIPQRTEGMAVQQPEDVGRAVEASVPESGSGTGNVRQAGETGAGNRGSDGRAEGRKSDALGSEDEHDHGRGTGDGTERDNIQLSFFPTGNEQKFELNSSEDKEGAEQSAPSPVPDRFVHLREKLSDILNCQPDAATVNSLINTAFTENGSIRDRETAVTLIYDVMTDHSRSPIYFSKGTEAEIISEKLYAACEEFDKERSAPEAAIESEITPEEALSSFRSQLEKILNFAQDSEHSINGRRPVTFEEYFEDICEARITGWQADPVKTKYIRDAIINPLKVDRDEISNVVYGWNSCLSINDDKEREETADRILGLYREYDTAAYRQPEALSYRGEEALNFVRSEHFLGQIAADAGIDTDWKTPFDTDAFRKFCISHLSEDSKATLLDVCSAYQDTLWTEQDASKLDIGDRIFYKGGECTVSSRDNILSGHVYLTAGDGGTWKDDNNGVMRWASRDERNRPILERLRGEAREIPSARENHEGHGDTVPDIPAKNFHISDDNLGEGTPTEKIQRNLDAVRTLKEAEKEDRNATPDEQAAMSRYIGWGGLPDIFDDSKENLTAQRNELKSLLTEDEYKAARESVLNAHFTSPVIIKGMYGTLGRMGFEGGNILEPSCGVGNFLGMLPEGMSSSRVYGVELDSITGRIAAKLYPEDRIKVAGFEKTDFPNDFFDAAVGNVPFGQYGVVDKDYEKNNFLIHDYFFAKTLDKVRPGGIVAFITSKGTLDKKNSDVRKYIAERADLLGAVRLPNTAFKKNAGTEVTSDILFLQKRSNPPAELPDWVETSVNAEGFEVNRYFAAHPEMIAGKLEMVSGAYGPELTCSEDKSIPFAKKLEACLSRIHGNYEPELSSAYDEDELAADAELIPAVPEARNFSYALVDNRVYYRENSVMRPVELSAKSQERMKGMIGLRDCSRELLEMQLNGADDSEVKDCQKKLNDLYDDFKKQNGQINSQANRLVFSDDSSYCLLCALEIIDDDGRFKAKSDIFTKRTVRKIVEITSADTPDDALMASLSEKGEVSLQYMSELCGRSEEDIQEELKGIIFHNPESGKWETADEYLSGNIREKIAAVESLARMRPEYAVNLEALNQVLPKKLEASDIEVRVGATWIPPHYIEDFMREVFKTPEYLLTRNMMKVNYSPVSGSWSIEGKNDDYTNTLVYSKYGTRDANAYKILEDSLNLKDSRVYYTVKDADGKERREIDKKATILVSQKQDAIKEEFVNWVFKDMDRRNDLVELYNMKFNSVRPREFDGSHLKFPGMSPEVTLLPYQKNAVARMLYGGNVLLAHCVGAGKTWEMATAAMELKRIGLAQKSLFVVPNHLTEQWGSDFLRLYPNANILVATKKDFETANRKKFCARIATGDYDAVIIGHTQFNKLPLSKERQSRYIQEEIDEIIEQIEETKESSGDSFSIKEMEKTRKSLEVKLEKLNDDSRKDDVVTFEQLGCDRVFVDESHIFKNLSVYTKLRNISGIGTTGSERASDMYAKCRYLDEVTGGKGITFASGTPISNSMTELYTNMRYLQHGTLDKLGLGQFDAWASTFGETHTGLELAPESNTFIAKTRFSKFFNLPELMSLFKEAADIQTPDMLKIAGIPEAIREDVVSEPSDIQLAELQRIGDRAKAVRNRMVDPHEDNMLKITTDGRKLALDQRLIDPYLPDDPNSKVNKCVEKAFGLWQESSARHGTQLIFCDEATPNKDGKFSIYDEIKNKLVEKGVPAEEIAFMQDHKTEKAKADLFRAVKHGKIRFLLGSTSTMGAGTNVQDKLVALHHVDVPWRPSDIEQQEGRILRRGNTNKEVHIFRYLTKNTFDAYSWQLIMNKQKFISQIMTSKSPVRSCEDIDDAVISASAAVALCVGDDRIKEKMDLDIKVSKLKLAKANYNSEVYSLENKIYKEYPARIVSLTEHIKGTENDIALYKANMPADKDVFSMKVGETVYDKKQDAGQAVIDICRTAVVKPDVSAAVGQYLGFDMSVRFNSFSGQHILTLKNEISHDVYLGENALGTVIRINNVLDEMEKSLNGSMERLETVKAELETAKEQIKEPFRYEQELSDSLTRLNELNAQLDIDKDNETAEEKEEDPEQPEEHDEDTEKIAEPDAGYTAAKETAPAENNCPSDPGVDEVRNMLRKGNSVGKISFHSSFDVIRRETEKKSPTVEQSVSRAGDRTVRADA